MSAWGMLAWATPQATEIARGSARTRMRSSMAVSWAGRSHSAVPGAGRGGTHWSGARSWLADRGSVGASERVSGSRVADREGESGSRVNGSGGCGDGSSTGLRTSGSGGSGCSLSPRIAPHAPQPLALVRGAPQRGQFSQGAMAYHCNIVTLCACPYSRSRGRRRGRGRGRTVHPATTTRSATRRRSLCRARRSRARCGSSRR
jgi:hypothetical protein